MMLSFLLASVSIVDARGATKAGVEIRPSPGKGMGAFTKTKKHLGDVLGWYDGEVLTEQQRRARIMQIGPLDAHDEEWLESRHRRGVRVSADYLLGLGDGTYIDAEDPAESNWCRYINHDSDPNVGLFREKWEDGETYPTFIVLRTCEPGEELCFDYGEGFWIDEDAAGEEAHREQGAEHSLYDFQ
mmetsp:Transcript_745/g.2079  ORF Transcript_745/g.2079 Transcript_745/m.2079 type:complete len:186 (+) Transcript_745:26-583(+)